MSRPTVHMGLPMASLWGPNRIPQLPSFLVGATAWDPSGTHAQRAGQPLSRDPHRWAGDSGNARAAPPCPPPAPGSDSKKLPASINFGVIQIQLDGDPARWRGCVCWGGG